MHAHPLAIFAQTVAKPKQRRLHLIDALEVCCSRLRTRLVSILRGVGILEHPIAFRQIGDLQQQERNKVAQKRMAARKRWSRGRAEWGNQSWTKERGAYAGETGFVEHIENVPDGKTT